MLMPNKKSLTERILELKKKYLQPANIIQKIKETAKNTVLITITSAMLLGYATSVLASEPLTVKKYIQQNNYNLSSIFQLYLKPLNENGLDENEKKAIDIIANAPEEKQEEVKTLAKAIYNNGQLTPKISAELENLNLPSEKQEQVNGLEEKVTKETENPVDIYAVIANGCHYKRLESDQTTCMIMFYELLRKNGVSDANIKLLMLNPDNDDFTQTVSYEKRKKSNLSKYLPSNKEQIEVDDNNITLNKILDTISKIPSDYNDLIYIFYTAETPEKKGRVEFPGGYLISKKLIRALENIEFEKLILLEETCLGGLGKKLEEIDNCVIITASSEKETANAGILSYMLVKYYNKDSNASVRKLIDNINKELSRRIGYSKFKLFCSNENYCNEPLIPNNHLTQ